MRRQARANPAVRGRQCNADALQGPAQAEGLGLRDRQVINDAQGARRSCASSRIIMHAMLRDEQVRAGLGLESMRQEAESSSQEERRPREGADDGGDFVAGDNRWPTAIST